jgi:pimeloyl-ACP methyl ester carboxylesterase
VIGPAPHPEPAGFAARVRWAANFGGVRTGHTYNSMARGLLASLLRSPDYSPADAIRAIRGITATQAALLPELESLDLADTLPSLDCPVVMIQGRHDQVAPGAAAERYAGSLTAPSKQFAWFEHSAHLPPPRGARAVPGGTRQGPAQPAGQLMRSSRPDSAGKIAEAGLRAPS